MLRKDLEALRILKHIGKTLNVGKKIVGHVPGVKIGDAFQFRMELNILGIHGPSQSDIDYMQDIATKEIYVINIVVSRGYDDDTGSSDVLIYTCQGGQGKSENQKLERGNLALANSVGKKKNVRVIRGRKFEGGFLSKTIIDG